MGDKILLPILMVLLVILLAMNQATAANDCLEYGPALVEVKGTIRQEVFPGRPNYESIAKGDEPEHCWILHLDKPICVKGRPNDDIDVSQAGVKKLQLVLQPGDFKGKFINKRVVIKGKLFGAHTGHHHTAVLIEATNMELEK